MLNEALLRARSATGRPLGDTERQALFTHYARCREPAVLERLVVAHLPLAQALARRYALHRRPDPDLEQVACEGLVKALKRFDPERGTPFSAFAVPTILGELRRHLRDTRWALHVPRKVQDRLIAARHEAKRLAAVHGRWPTPGELAELLGCSEEEVVEALFAASASRTVPLDCTPSDDDGFMVAETVGDGEPGYEFVECWASIEAAMPALTQDEFDVVRLRFGNDLTQREIASRLRISRSHVGRLLASALETMRRSAVGVRA